MLFIGQRITIATPSVRRALEARRAAPIQGLARRQALAGAHALDLNVGFLPEAAAVEQLAWLAGTVQEAVALPLSLDSVHPAAIAAGLSVCRGEALINSCTADPEKLAALLPLAAARRCQVIVLPLDSRGMPATVRERVDLVRERVLPAAAHHGVPRQALLVDVLVPSVGTGPARVLQALGTARLIREELGLRTLAGLGNIAYRAPLDLKAPLQMALLAMLAGAGLDAAILDPLNPELMGVARALATGHAGSVTEESCLQLEAEYRGAAPGGAGPLSQGSGPLAGALAALEGRA
ncbi:MAG: methyltetrahydrofolate--corrinoid methyltransferase [Dehalococcoidia bacterium]|nr:methyltetrahydrofolate--corrinoid methyltransferase [Dehalococcoidia bacterium]